MVRETADVVKQFLVGLDIYIDGFMRNMESFLDSFTCLHVRNYLENIRANERRYLADLRRNILETDEFDPESLDGKLIEIWSGIVRIRSPAESLIQIKEESYGEDDEAKKRDPHLKHFQNYIRTLNAYERHISKLSDYLRAEAESK